MERLVGTVSRGIRAPIIREGDDIAQIVVDSVVAAAQQTPFELYDKDVIAVTEAVVARAQGNYATVEQIAAAHGGRVAFGQNVPNGAKATVWLPCAEKKAPVAFGQNVVK